MLRVQLFAISWLLSAAVVAQSPFRFAGAEVRPATRHDVLIPIESEGASTAIPVTILHGATDGPVLGVTAGVHGFEYPPIMAAQRLAESIDPARLRGTVILVRIANLAGFITRSPYVNPLDGLNLNRSFPGSPDGTVTERIAHFLTENVIAPADYFLDMHAGDAPEDLMAYGAYYHADDRPEASEAGRRMAIALGYDYIVRFNTDGKEYMRPDRPSLYCSAEAFKRGIPAADIECGRLGMAEPLLIQSVERAVHGVLADLNMLPPEAGTDTPSEPAFIMQRSYLEAEADGIFHTTKSGGDYVTAGMEIGYLTDYFGRRTQTVVADTNGILLLVLGTPPVNAGETIAVIGVVD